MNPGELNVLLTIEQPTTTQDTDYGSSVTTWSTLSTEWARVVYAPAGESVQAKQLNATNTAQVRIRYRADVTALMRLQIDSLPWSISAVVPAGRKEWLDITAAR